MRKFEFRGKQKYDLGWAYGELVQRLNSVYIGTSWGELVLVDAETVGQYIDRIDKCNTPVFEGDILVGIGVVIWIPEEARFGIECVGEIHEITFEELQQSQMEIIGNIYDNPRMVEEYK